MARRPVHPASKKPSVGVDKSTLSMRSLEVEIADIRLQTQVLELAERGFSHREIAEELKISLAKIPSFLTEALGELNEKRDKAVDKFFSLHRRRYELAIRTWMPRANGYIAKIKNDDGAIVETYVPPCPKAAMIFAKLQADYGKMFGLTKLRVEHTGVHGGPIMNFNANIDWPRVTNEQLAQAAAGNEDVIRQLSGVGANPSSSDPRDEEAGRGSDPPSRSHHRGMAR